jgi:hypothetical protein
MALTQPTAVKPLNLFKIESRSMGALMPFGDIGAALEELEGPHQR